MASLWELQLFSQKCEMTSWPEIQFFHSPKIWRHPWFVIWEFLEGIYRNYVQVYTGCNQMHQTYVLFLRILSESMPALPQQEGEGQHRTRMFVSMLCTTNQHVLNIQLTDMWYLDISSLALKYIYLPRITNNFGIDQLKMSSNKPNFMVDFFFF